MRKNKLKWGFPQHKARIDYNTEQDNNTKI